MKIKNPYFKGIFSSSDIISKNLYLLIIILIVFIIFLLIIIQKK